MHDSIDRLTRLFLRFPGIGERQARRFAYFILAQEAGYVDALSNGLVQARSRAHTCTRCFRIYEGNPGLCEICADPSRDQSVIAVVEKSQDIAAFQKTDYHGLFFNLGGLIPIVQKNIIEGTNANLLIDRVAKESGNPLTEVILAFPITPNGEHTDAAIRELLAPVQGSISITSLGRGLSTGAELEYADSASLSASLKKRE
jgi:recombination protein RecR